jgi:LmbE family N-acetylglucosaminyl deacetylase
LIEEGLQPYKVRQVLLWASEEPNRRSDITDTFDIKMAALRCHKSQIGDSSFPEFEERLRERCRMLAEGEDYELAEAFYQIELWQ